MSALRIFLPSAFVASVLIVAPPTDALAGSSVKDDEEVILFPSLAHQGASGEWIADVRGWIFEPEEDSLWRGAVVESLRSALQVQDHQENFFRQRARWFLVDNEGGKKLKVSVEGVEAKMGKSGSDGHFKGTIVLPASRKWGLREDGRPLRSKLTMEVSSKGAKGRGFRGPILLVPRTGLSVISDVDDTIKLTGAKSRKKTLESTFLESFRPVPGMASLYRSWQREGAVFHYVSASPWQLFAPLHDFLRRLAFPKGSLHLREFRVKDHRRWNLLENPSDYKKANIRALLSRFPERKFILVGDTGQSDPEIYSEMASEFPKQVQAIYLREVDRGDMGQGRTRLVLKRAGEVPVLVFREAKELSGELPS